MKKKRFTEEQISYTLRQAESGTPVAEVCRNLGISEQTFYRWKRKYAGMGIAELGMQECVNNPIIRKSITLRAMQFPK